MKANYFLVGSIAVYIFALTQPCYCTTQNCSPAFLAAVLGILGATLGGAALSWFANPLLLAAWLSFRKLPNTSSTLSILATVVAASFLCFTEIVGDEAGNHYKIIGYKAGYWLWLTSMLILLAGNIFTLRTTKAN